MAAMDSNGRLWISTRHGSMALVDTLTESVAAVPLPGNRQVVVTSFPDPAPSGGEVVVRVKASAICRSDLSLIR